MRHMLHTIMCMLVPLSLLTDPDKYAKVGCWKYLGRIKCHHRHAYGNHIPINSASNRGHWHTPMQHMRIAQQSLHSTNAGTKLKTHPHVRPMHATYVTGPCEEFDGYCASLLINMVYGMLEDLRGCRNCVKESAEVKTDVSCG
jgi:hypothetical protein